MKKWIISFIIAAIIIASMFIAVPKGARVKEMASDNGYSWDTEIGRYQRDATTSFTKVSKINGGVSLRWEQQIEAEGYQIEYSLSSDFKTSQNINIDSYEQIALNVTSLKPYRQYYFRIRTYKKYKGRLIYSDWSKTRAGRAIPAKEL